MSDPPSGLAAILAELKRRRVKKPHPRPSGRPLSVDGEGHYEVKG